MKRFRPAPPLEKLVIRDAISFFDIAQKSRPEANNTSRYLHWEKLKYKTPPDGLTVEEWWFGLKLHRMLGRIEVPLRDVKGKFFYFSNNPLVLHLLSKLDEHKEHVFVKEKNMVSDKNDEKYYVSSLEEEAITSSQVEGAAVTRTVAKEMLRTGRSPLGRDERMILNNYRTMQRIRDLKDQPLTIELILEIHRIISEGTLDDSSMEGRFRGKREKVRIEDSVSGEIIHIPPPAEGMEKRMRELCKFANEQENSSGYIHPVVRSIILHFWLSYEHPFVDGNGRTARALFYWSMLNHGYRLFEYISISREILDHPASYYRSFIYTENDDNDLNYFITDQLLTIRKSIQKLHDFLEKKVDEKKQMTDLLRNKRAFNHRQIMLLSEALNHPECSYTVSGYKAANGISTQTARTDLEELVSEGLFTQFKRGKACHYMPVEDLSRQLNSR